MRSWTTLICIAALLTGGIALVAHAADKAKTTVEGELIDMYCFSAGGAKGAGHATCSGKCMASGIPAGILVDGKAWTLLTNSKPLAEYGSKMIRATGALNADTQSFTPDKIEVKDGDAWKEVKLDDEHHKM